MTKIIELRVPAPVFYDKIYLATGMVCRICKFCGEKALGFTASYMINHVKESHVSIAKVKSAGIWELQGEEDIKLLLEVEN